MINNDYYSQEVHGPYELYDIGNFELEEGGTIPDCKIAYNTLGTLNEAKDNAILVTAWYSGTTKIMEQIYVGDNHALDPNKYQSKLFLLFIIIITFLAYSCVGLGIQGKDI